MTPRSAAAEILDAAGRGQIDALKRLISSGADISATDEDGNTALSRAAAAGKIDAVSTLLSARVDVNAENHMGERPLMLLRREVHRRHRRRLASPRSGPDRDDFAVATPRWHSPRAAVINKL